MCVTMTDRASAQPTLAPEHRRCARPVDATWPIRNPPKPPRRADRPLGRLGLGRMNRSCSDRWTGLVLAILIAAVAEPPCARAERHEVDAEYEQAYRRGVELFEAGDWQRARDAFEAAYQLRPQPRLLVNLGSTYRRTGDTAAARTYYERFLREADATDPTRAQVTRALAELQDPPRAPARFGWLQIAGLAAAGVGVGALSYGVYENQVASNATSDLQARLAGRRLDTTAAQHDLDVASTAGQRSTIAVIGGGVLVVAGVAGIVLGRPAAPPHPASLQLAVVPRGDGWTVHVSGQF